MTPGAEGRLDEPAAGATVERGLFTVSGWALFPGAATARVEIRLGERSLDSPSWGSRGPTSPPSSASRAPPSPASPSPAI